MRVEDFRRRAAECIRWAQRAHTAEDRELLLELARAWCGTSDGEAAVLQPVARPRSPYFDRHADLH
jgi:hypothetical protein